MGGACFEDEVSERDGIECGCHLGAMAIQGRQAMKKWFRS